MANPTLMRYRTYHLPGDHDQESHGNWASEMSTDELVRHADPNVPLDRLAREDRGYIDNMKKHISANPDFLKQPLELRRRGNRTIIEDGHHRLIAARELGFRTLPVRWVDKP